MSCKELLGLVLQSGEVPKKAVPRQLIVVMFASSLPLLEKDISVKSRSTRFLTIDMMRSWVRDFLAASAAGQSRRLLTQSSAAYQDARISAYD